MMIGYDRLESTSIHMGIDLCRGDVGVAQQFLDNSKIRTTSKQMCRE